MVDSMVDEEKSLVVFQDRKIRRIWFDGEWYFSVVDIVAVLTEQLNHQKARKYWNKLSQRLREEGSEVVTSCHRLKLPAEDGKLRETDCTKNIVKIDNHNNPLHIRGKRDRVATQSHKTMMKHPKNTASLDPQIPISSLYYYQYPFNSSLIENGR